MPCCAAEYVKNVHEEVRYGGPETERERARAYKKSRKPNVNVFIGVLCVRRVIGASVYMNVLDARVFVRLMLHWPLTVFVQ